MIKQYVKLTDDYTEEGLSDTILDMTTMFRSVTLTAFSKLRSTISGLIFSPFTKSDLKDISTNALPDSGYKEVASITVPTILGLNTTLPVLSKTVYSNMNFISTNRDIDDIISSIRTFITKPDTRMDISRLDVDISSKTVSLENRITKLGEHFSMDVNVDAIKFNKLFGNMSTYKECKHTILETSLLTNSKLTDKLESQYKLLLNYADTLNDLKHRDNDKAVSNNIGILLLELEYCANYFTFASGTISLSHRISEVYEAVTKRIK